jgi:hypothetical protein
MEHIVNISRGNTANNDKQAIRLNMLFIIGFIDCCCIWMFTGKNTISAFTRQGSQVRNPQRPPIKTRGYAIMRSLFFVCGPSGPNCGPSVAHEIFNNSDFDPCLLALI